MLSVLGVALFFLGCSKEEIVIPENEQSNQEMATLKSAAKPAAKLLGEMELNFNFPTDPGVPVWVGTIKFEGIEEVFGMCFCKRIPEKVTGPQNANSQASHFWEYFKIYDSNDESVIYLAGSDEGVTTLANSKYRMNGEIEEANGEFEKWLGRNVHMSGFITWQVIDTPEGPVTVPATAPGTLKIN